MAKKRKIGRNEPCWCGSGKKYKRCHLGRENESSPRISEVIKEHQKAFNKAMCLCPEEWSENCEGSIVKAHTVSRKMLEKIAVGGHVYGPNKHFGALVRDEGKIRFKKMGLIKPLYLPDFAANMILKYFSQ